MNENKHLMRYKLEAFIRMGVTGHRIFSNEQIIREKVDEVLLEIDNILKNTSYNLIAVSPLAEGADRIVAEEILAWKGKKNFLEVILPMDEKEYLNDFKTQKSKNNFFKLLNQATSVQTLKMEKTRNESYENVGRAIVNNCNLLIVIWNGEVAAGRGGTEEIVNYARKVGRSLFWINSNTYKIKKEMNSDNTFEYLEKIDITNTSSVNLR